MHRAAVHLPQTATLLCALQWMESGRSGASGRCVVRSVRDSDGGSATLPRPVTEARCVREKVRAWRTAQGVCVRKVSMC